MNATVFSIILPVYNQEEHLPILFKTYTEALKNLEDVWELIIVVNGSKDISYETARNLSASIPSVKVYNLPEGGWGRAVKYGISVAQGKYICYTNSARTKVEDLVLMLKYAKINDNSVIKATRIIRESFIRRLGSTLYNIENRLLMRVPIWDVNGTPKVIPRWILDSFELVSDDDLIDAEIMARCFKKGISIIEIPVINTMRIAGKSTTNFRSAFKMYIGLLKLKNKI